MTKTTNFVWDPVSDCVISELDGSNAVQAVYTNEPQQYGGVLSQRRGATTSTLHADALGTTRALTSSTQTTTDTYLYDAWGNQVASTGTTVNPFRWVGRYGYYHDASTGLVYVRARMYQPTVARWCSVDPLWHVTQAEFVYCRNRPPIEVDPSGLDRVGGQDRDTLEFDPENLEGHPWKRERTGFIGLTRCSLSVQCYCTRFHSLYLVFPLIRYDCWYEVTCDLKLRTSISLDDRNLPRAKKGGPYRDTIEGVYAHEQRHVQNCRNKAKSLLHKYFGGARSSNECDPQVPQVTKKIEDDWYAWWKAERQHGNPESPHGTEFTPIGNIPTTPRQ